MDSIISDDELRRRLNALKGKRVRNRDDRPKAGTNKSTTFRIHDLALLARVSKCDISNFMAQRRKIGELTKTRIYRKLLEIEGGFVTKSQWGVYHFHDEPQRPAVRIMQIDLMTGRITNTPEPVKRNLPPWKKVFGG